MHRTSNGAASKLDATKRTESQCSRILRHLDAGKALTPIESLERWGCFRLAARIKNLRDDGYPIRSKLVSAASNKRFSMYWLANRR